MRLLLDEKIDQDREILVINPAKFAIKIAEFRTSLGFGKVLFLVLC